MREPPNIPVELLRACLRERYDLEAIALEFLPRGYDYRAGVYRVMDDRGAVYLLKVTSRPLYEPGCLVPRYLRDLGITAVVAPLPTKSGAVWATLSEWTVIIYPFLEGDTSLAGMTDEQWKETGSVFRKIHQAPLPPGGFPSLRKESFDPSEYVRWVHVFEVDQQRAQRSGSDAARALRDAWMTHRSKIEIAATSLEQLAAALRSRALRYVICHADVHAANLLRDPASHVFALDWDEVMLAPKERDFIFIREPYAQSFWEGYGVRASDEIDWMALTYFRWERVIQDLIEEAQQALFRSDVSEEARLTAAQRFAATFAPGGNLDAVYAAAAHLPRDLGAPRRQGKG
ncbi:MAG TPA: aminoglycoside phosphotransferase family protein [Ktedonobacterales bacterium]|nr:aminoglycoside phosphotransferase family protein [Ktedonobacterales bacterium]